MRPVRPLTSWIGVLALALGGLCSMGAALPAWRTDPDLAVLRFLLIPAFLLVAGALPTVLAPILPRSHRRSIASRGAVLFLGLGSLLLMAGIGVLPVQRAAESRHARRARAELNQRALAAQHAWSGLLANMEEASRIPPAILILAAQGPIDRAFNRLSDWSRSHPIIGAPAPIALYDIDGKPLVWWGPLRDLEPQSHDEGFRLVRSGTSDLLILQRSIPEGTVRLAQVQFLVGNLRSAGLGAESEEQFQIAELTPARPANPIATILGIDSAEKPGTVITNEEAIPESPSSSEAPSSVPSPAPVDARVALLIPDGKTLALAILRPAPASLLRQRFTFARMILSQGAIFAALIAGLCLLKRSAGATRGEIGLSMPEAATLFALVICARAGLLVLLHGPRAGGPLTGPGLFALQKPLGLMSSPADLLLTAIGVLATVHLLLGAFRGPVGSRRLGKSPLGRLGFGIAGLAGLAGAVRLIHSFPAAAKINPIHFQLLDPELPRLAILAAALALAAAPIAVALEAVRRGSVDAPEEAAIAGRRRLAGLSRRSQRVALIAAATLASGGALIAGGVEASRHLVERDLSGELARREERLRRILGEVLAHEADHPRWAMLRHEPTGSTEPGPAYESWAETELAVDGLRSAVAVLDADGTLRSEFTNSLPTGIYLSSAGESPTSPETTIRTDAYSLLTLRIQLLRGEGPLRSEGAVVGRLIVQISREPDNLTFFTRNDPLAAGYSRGGRDPIYDEFLGGEPVLVLYSEGEVVYSNALRPPPIRPELRQKLEANGRIWRRVDVGVRPHSLYYFPAGEQIAAIGYPEGGWSERLSALVRFALLAVAGSLAVRGVFLLASSPRASLRWATIGWIQGLRRSYSRRLLAALLLASMLPLLGLSAYLRSQVNERTRAGVETAGIAALETARRLLQDYLESVTAGGAHAGEIGKTAPISDDALFWVSRVVREDLSVYLDGRLAAASRPDLYITGLLPRCLDGEMARQVLAHQAPYALREEPLGTESAFFIYAPIELPGRGETGVLALPLTAPQRAQQHEANEVGEGLLTATALLGALLGAIAVLTSRRISGPIRELTRASARVAEGDYRVRLPVVTEDETGVMVDAFNRMARALETQREDLRRRGDYIEKILLNATTGVISTDSAGVVRTINPAARILLELPGEVDGRQLPEVLRHQPKLAPFARFLDDALARGEEKTEREVDLPAGPEQRRLRCVVLPLKEEGFARPGWIILVEDLTEIVRSNRLAAWAEMARRIAHEIKNPLTPIQLSAEHLLRLHKLSDPSFDRVLEQCVQTILSQVRALREISAEFSTYSRLPDLKIEPADLAALAREALAPYRASPPRGVTVREDISPVSPVPLDARVFRRALVNLIENALHAMPEGGTLRLTVAAGPEGRVTVEVADSGVGMDETTLGRIFEPYFSTRDHGIGLGLAIARRAVEEHGGTLTARSEPGHGTVMTIVLPAPAMGPPRDVPLPAG